MAKSLEDMYKCRTWEHLFIGKDLENNLEPVQVNPRKMRMNCMIRGKKKGRRLACAGTVRRTSPAVLPPRFPPRTHPVVLLSGLAVDVDSATQLVGRRMEMEALVL